MSRLLDPWEDAAFIAARIPFAEYRLIVLIGAEAWCEKCRKLRPFFDAIAANAAANDLMLWFDLEEHQEFIGDYIPEDLPELLIYRQGILSLHQSIPEISERALKQVLAAPTSHPKALKDTPGIAKRLTTPNWANNAKK